MSSSKKTFPRPIASPVRERVRCSAKYSCSGLGGERTLEDAKERRQIVKHQTKKTQVGISTTLKERGIIA